MASFTITSRAVLNLQVLTAWTVPARGAGDHGMYWAIWIVMSTNAAKLVVPSWIWRPRQSIVKFCMKPLKKTKIVTDEEL